MRKAKLDVLIPSANTVMEPDLYRIALKGITFHFARVRATKDNEEEIARILIIFKIPPNSFHMPTWT